MNDYNKTGFLTCILMLVLDLSWIALMKKKYGNWISSVQKKEMVVKMSAAIIAYALMCVVVVFVLLPLTYYSYNPFVGAILGGCIYGIYNATNYATLSNYSLTMAIVDTIWGIVLFTILSGFIFLYR
jgi:uncharacterized membrane protein